MSKYLSKSRDSVHFEERSEKEPLQIMCSDLLGPMRHFPIGRAPHFTTILNSYSEFCMVCVMVRNPETADVIMNKIWESENIFI